MLKGFLAAGWVALWCAAGCGARSEVWLDDYDYPSAGSAPTAGAVPSAGAGVGGGPAMGAGGVTGASGAPARAGAGGSAGACSSSDGDGSCGPGLTCANGLCVPRCDAQADCANGYVCSGSVCAVRAARVAAGERHACVATADGAIYCWGYGISGQLGHGIFSSSETPVPVVGFPRPGASVLELTAGGSFTCASLSDSSVSCWGGGDLGQLGDRRLKASAVPVQAAIIPPSPAHIAGGTAHGCALTKDRRVGCWGNNSDGQLGVGNYERSVEFSDLGSLGPLGDTRVTVGGSHSCSFSRTGVQCWGDNRFWQLGTQMGDTSANGTWIANVVPDGVTLIDVAAGGQHTCALLSDHSVRCWGDNTWQQLGSTTVMRSTTPLLVDGVANAEAYATQICAGARHSCVMMTDGSVRCWGAGGALGNGSATASARPVKVVGLTEGSQSVTRIACGGTTSCALMSDGSARCWSAVVGRSLSF